MMSRKNPSPLLLMILLPMKPATRPRMIHARNDISFLLDYCCSVSGINPKQCAWAHRRYLIFYLLIRSCDENMTRQACSRHGYRQEERQARSKQARVST